MSEYVLSRGKRIFVVVVASLLGLLLVVIAYLFVAGRGYVIPTAANSPTIEVGDRVWGRSADGEPERGEMYTYSRGGTQERIRRVIAIGGDRVEIADGAVSVNGELLSEPYAQATDQGDFEVTLAKDEVWVMGDNRPKARDSRWEVPLPAAGLITRVVFRYWPLDRMGGV